MCYSGWPARFAVHWEWQRLIGGSAAVVPAIRGRPGALRRRHTFPDAPGRTGLCSLLPLAAAFCAWAAGPGFRLWAAAGVFYAGGLLLATLTLRHAPFFGSCAIGWLFAVVWGTDVCAYFGGRLIGGPKLAPAISPGKTWSGFGVGVVCGAGFGALAAHFWPNVDAPLGPLFLLGLVAGALAQGGDLFESWIKRRFNVKDRAASFPAMAASWTGSTALSPPPFSRPCSVFRAVCRARRPACFSGPRIVSMLEYRPTSPEETRLFLALPARSAAPPRR